jgi:collagenase-like PrtC family protease
MQLTLAPIPFYWSKAKVFEFYQQAAEWPLDRICLGETICSKRRELRLDDWLSIGRMLQQNNKTVALSTLALLQSASELKTLNSLCRHNEFSLEVNDLAAAEQCQQLGLTFSAGPYLNIYNSDALKLLCQDGLERWTLPVELGRRALVDILQAIRSDELPVKTEVMVHGYLPLALSARCFTARAEGLPKDQCQRICLNYPQGIAVTSSDEQRLFTLNGIQTLSGQVVNLLDQIPTLKQLGVDSVRISPSQMDMTAIIQTFAERIHTPQSSASQLLATDECNGYWFDQSGIHRVEK